VLSKSGAPSYDLGDTAAGGRAGGGRAFGGGTPLLYVLRYWRAPGNFCEGQWRASDWPVGERSLLAG
jgi:hypothetical protein